MQTRSWDTHENSHTPEVFCSISSQCWCAALTFSFAFLLLCERVEGGQLEHTLKPLPLQTHGQIKERREGREEKKKTQTSGSQWGLAETHAVPSAWLTTEYRMKCLWLAGPGHVSGGPVATQVLWLPDYKAGPAGGPIWARATGATASRWDKKTQPLPLRRGGGRGVRVGGCACLCLTGLNLAETEREKPPSPRKKKKVLQRKPQVQGSHLQTGSCYGFQMEKMAAMPGEQATTRVATTTNQIRGIKKRREQWPHTDEQQATNLRGAKGKLPRQTVSPNAEHAHGESVVLGKKPFKGLFFKYSRKLSHVIYHE